MHFKQLEDVIIIIIFKKWAKLDSWVLVISFIPHCYFYKRKKAQKHVLLQPEKTQRAKENNAGLTQCHTWDLLVKKKIALDISAAANTAIAGYIIVSFIVLTAFLHDFRGVASTIRSRNHLEICEGFLLGISVCVFL